MKFVAACPAKAYTVSKIKVIMLGTDVALVTSDATQTGTCMGSPLPPNITAATNFVRRNGKWLIIMHAEEVAAK